MFPQMDAVYRMMRSQWFGSAGSQTPVLNIPRKLPASSMAWWVGPSSPTDSPQWVATIFTLAALISFTRAWSLARLEINAPNVLANGIVLLKDIPPAAEIMFCSAIPNSTY